MIIKELKIINGIEFIYVYSDSNHYIEGGEPHGLYVDALDPKEFNREYEETNIEIPTYDSEGNIIEDDIGE